MRFRAVPAIAAVLLTAACASTSPTATPATSSSIAPTAAAPTAATSVSASPSPTVVQRPQLTVAIPVAKLPYQPVAGAPALGDVSILKTAADPCTIPANDSGNEGQLLNAQMNVTVLIVTFEFTNPCTKPLTYAFKVTQAIGSATGPSGGDPTETTTQSIAPGKSVTLKVNVDPKVSLTQAQLQQLWVGITHIAKQPGY